MKRIHYLLLGLLVSLTIAAVSPGLPPTRIIAGNSTVVVVTNGVNSFTLTASGGVGTSNGLATNLSVYSSGTTNRALRVWDTNSIELNWMSPSVTDGSNYQRLALSTTTNSVKIAAETAGTGADNINLTLSPAGTGKVVIGAIPAGLTAIQTGLIVSGDTANGNLSVFSANGAKGITLNTAGPYSTIHTDWGGGTEPILHLSSYYGKDLSQGIFIPNGGNVGIFTNAPTERLHVLGNALIATNLTANDLSLSKTITAPATTGDQTINKAAGRVNIAAAGTTVVVTCSLVTANSIIIAVAATADATAMVTSVVPAAGSFTINTVATTAETAFNFLIVN